MPNPVSIFGRTLPGGYDQTAPPWWISYGTPTTELAAPEMDAVRLFVVANELLPWLSPMAQADIATWLTGENFLGVQENLPEALRNAVRAGLDYYAGGQAGIPRPTSFRDWATGMSRAAGAARVAGQQLEPLGVNESFWLQQLNELNAYQPKTRRDWLDLAETRKRLLGSAPEAYSGLAEALLGETYVRPTLFSQPGRKYAAGGISYWG